MCIRDRFYVPPGLVAVLSVIYGSVSVVAVVGNLLVIVVVAASARMRTVNNRLFTRLFALRTADLRCGTLYVAREYATDNTFKTKLATCLFGRSR